MSADEPFTSTKRKAPHHDDENFTKRIRQVGHLYPSPVKGNVLHSSDEEQTNGKVAHVFISDSAIMVAFDSKLLKDFLLHLNLDKPHYNVANVSFELGAIQLIPARFRTAALYTNFPVRTEAIVEVAFLKGCQFITTHTNIITCIEKLVLWFNDGQQYCEGHNIHITQEAYRVLSLDSAKVYTQVTVVDLHHYDINEETSPLTTYLTL